MAKITGRIKKIGEGLKKRLSARKAVKPAVKAAPRRRKTAVKIDNAAAPAGTLTVEKAKYWVTHPESRISASIEPVSIGRPRPERRELPQKYGKDLIVLQVRDPWWLHTYWEVTSGAWQRLRAELGRFFDTAKKTLRCYDVSYINFNGSNAHSYRDIEVAESADNWYIDTAAAGRSWCVDLGLRLQDGRFITIVRSNVVATPLDGPSWITDEEWMVPEDLFVKLYASASGLSGSPVKVKKPWLEWKNRGMASGGIASGAISPSRKKQEGRRKFWLTVNTELIVYGATEPDAKVTVCGEPIALRPDGTFSLRFALPDGKQVIPVKGISSDGVDEKTITPIVTKETK